MTYTTQTVCRNCHSDKLETAFSLGELYPSNFIDRSETGFEKVPLDLVVCKTCDLVQLKHTYSQDEMYRKYFYMSGLNGSMVSSLKDIVNNIEEVVKLNDFDTVIDIGCNDGTLLDLYENKSLVTVGFDPAYNLKRPDCSYFYNDYFTANWYFDPLGHVPAKVITAIAMFYDLPDPNRFLADVKSILHKDGVFVVQLTDLISMLHVNAFDNICHEHLEYYSITNLLDMFSKAGLEIFDISFNSVNGGSVRVLASHPGTYKVNDLAISNAIILQEKVLSGDLVIDALDDFWLRITDIKQAVVEFLKLNVYLGAVIHGLGASTKGNTLLQFFGIGNDLIKKIEEVNKDKFGKVTLGTDIEIIEETKQSKPDCFFILPWHFIDFFLKVKDDYLRDGGTLFVPLPTPKLYYYEDGECVCTELKL